LLAFKTYIHVFIKKPNSTTVWTLTTFFWSICANMSIMPAFFCLTYDFTLFLIKKTNHAWQFLKHSNFIWMKSDLSSEILSCWEKVPISKSIPPLYLNEWMKKWIQITSLVGKKWLTPLNLPSEKVSKSHTHNVCKYIFLPPFLSRNDDNYILCRFTQGGVKVTLKLLSQTLQFRKIIKRQSKVCKSI